MVAQVKIPADPQISEVLPGQYLVRKPAGPAAFSVVQQANELLAAQGGRKWPVCHGGALDPFAEGLMLVLVGPATKLFASLHAAPKTYVATVKWGVETDNGDLLGQPVAHGDPGGLTAAQLAAALEPMLGWTDQVPPLHSNKRVNGERAWRKAQRGDQFELPGSRVYLHSARWVSHALPDQSVLELVCRGGYYVRSLARDLGRALGCRAHLTALDRTAIGPWPCPPLGERVHIHREGLLPWLPARILTDEEMGALKRVSPLPTTQHRPPGWPFPPGFPPAPLQVRAFHLGKLVALLEETAGAWLPTVVLRGGV
ncbi:MAG: truB1 [Myxococcaceae bacterium]|nr:truB1 [Myxococcaceae bacterium]